MPAIVLFAWEIPMGRYGLQNLDMKMKRSVDYCFPFQLLWKYGLKSITIISSITYQILRTYISSQLNHYQSSLSLLENATYPFLAHIFLMNHFINDNKNSTCVICDGDIWECQGVLSFELYYCWKQKSNTCSLPWRNLWKSKYVIYVAFNEAKMTWTRVVCDLTDLSDCNN